MKLFTFAHTIILMLACGWSGATQAAPFMPDIDDLALHDTFFCNAPIDCGASPGWNGVWSTAHNSRASGNKLDTPYGHFLEGLQNDHYLQSALDPHAGWTYPRQEQFATYIDGSSVMPVPEAPVYLMLLIGLGLLVLSGHDTKSEKFSL